MKRRPLFRRPRPRRYGATRAVLLLGAVLAIVGAGLASVLAR